MADPLSIAASVAGLIALSGSIYKIVGDFVERAAHPPQSAYALLLSVSEMRMALNSVSDLIDNFLKYPPKRRALVRLDHLIICLTQAVLSFSELEKFVNLWVTRPQRSLFQRWKLANEEEKISRFNRRLQDNKLSISLVLNILQCESDTDAQEYRISLQEMMEQVINESKSIRNRVDELGSLMLRGSGPSIATTSRRQGTTSTNTESIAETDVADDDGTSTIRTTLSGAFSMIPRLFGEIDKSPRASLSDRLEPSAPLDESRFRMPFEDDLAQSWVYARVRRTECDISFSSQRPSGLWSMLSGLSLGQISNISVIALPITLNDVSNNSWYKDPARQALDPLELGPPKLAQNSSHVNTLYDIAVLGECEVGKTSLIETLQAGKTFHGEKYTTLAHYCYTSLEIDGAECRLRISDTPGLGTTDYAILVNDAIRYARAFVLVFSLTDRNSFRQIQILYDMIMKIKQLPPDQPPPIVLVANKVDLRYLRIIYLDEWSLLAEKLNCAFFKCSIYDTDSISRPFVELVRCLSESSPH